MSPTSVRRRPLARLAVVLAGLMMTGIGYAIVTGASDASAAPHGITDTAAIAHGKNLFEQECATCHGMFAQGQRGVAPSLIGVGSAAVNFQVSTGRMPAKEPEAEMPRRQVQLSPQDIHDLAVYIQSLGGGPTVPTRADVSQTGANVGLGQQLFVADCAQCHNFQGAGGALTYGKYAPALTKSTPTQIFEAMLTGPEAMPVFNDTTITPQQKRDIIAYVVQTRNEPNPGGFSLGRVGPVTEGLVVFLGMLLFMVLAALWITAKHGKAHE